MQCPTEPPAPEISDLDDKELTFPSSALDLHPPRPRLR